MWDLIVSVPDHCLSFYFRGRYEICVCTTDTPDIIHIGPMPINGNENLKNLQSKRSLVKKKNKFCN